MKSIKLAYTPGDEGSERHAESVAVSLSAALRQRPDRFDELRAQRCCIEAETWMEGHDEPGLSEAVAGLAIGQAAARPIKQYIYYTVPLRIDLSEAPLPPVTSFEVPSPKYPDLDAAAVEQPDALLESVQGGIERTLQKRASLTKAQRESLRDLLSRFL